MIEASDIVVTSVPGSKELRPFLADRLAQLTSRQLHDLFAAARFPARADLATEEERKADVDAWVAAFKDKVAQVRGRTCRTAPATR